MKYALPFILGVLILSVDSSYGQSSAVYALNHPSQLRFTENKGQWDSRIFFKSPLPNGNLLIEKNGFYFVLLSPQDMSHIHHPGHAKNETVLVHGHAFRETFIGADPSSLATGNNAYPDYANYYLGNNPKFWASGARVFAQMQYQNLYHGIDMLMYGNEENPLRYDFIINPGADAAQIKLGYEGTTGLRVEGGDLRIGTSVGDLLEQRPFAYQEVNGFKQQVACYFVLNDSVVSFAFPKGYDKRLPLIIDPNIVFATYTGSTADNWGYTATYDDNGNMYVGGLVNAIPNPYSNDPTAYPVTTGAFQVTWGGGTGGFNGIGNGIDWPCDIGIAKFSSDGTSLIYATYLGGSDNETPSSLIVDPQNNLIVYGVSYSTNFPVTATAYASTYSGDGDIIVSKFNSSGTALLGSTYLGGDSADGINYDPQEFTPGNLKTNYGDQNRGEVTIDASGNIYVASCTRSSNFPVTTGAFQTTIGGAQDGCVFKLSPDCSQLLFSTFLGGSQDDACYSLNITQNGSLYVAGGTMSNNFPTTTGTLHTAYQGGNSDGFVTLLNNTGTKLVASSYIGTGGDDQVYFVKLDDDSNVYLMGQSTGNYPVKNAVYSNPGSGQFITKVNPSLTSVFYSTVFGNGGGAPNISPSAFLVDTCQNVYVAGWGATTNSVFATYSGQVFAKDISNMPLTANALQTTTDGNDFYFFVMSKNAQGILYGSYFGGFGDGTSTGLEHVDGGTSRFDKRGIIYEAICAGCGGTSLTPSTPGVWSPRNDSWNCNELGLKIAFNLAGTEVAIGAYPRATGCVPLTVQFQSVISEAVSFQWYFGDGDTSSSLNPLHTYMDTGTYHVVLVGTDSNSCNITDTARLVVFVRNDSLSANFLPSVKVVCDSDLVTLTATGFPTTQYSWNMGDNSLYSTQSVSHIYKAAGSYEIRLIETDSTKCNLKDTFTTPVTIPLEVNAHFTTSSSYGCIPLVVDFNTTSVPGAIYHWSFGDGDTATLPTVTHTFTTADTFRVQLIVSDTASCNKFDTAYSTIITIDSAASAAFFLSRTFYSCDSVFVTVWSTYQGASFQLWTMGDGTQVANVDSVSHWYNTGGTYTITHYLDDPRQVCKPDDTARIAISLKPLHVSLSVPDTVRCLPLTAHLTGGSLLFSTNYYWFFGDGDSTSGQSVSHTYAQTGVYDVRIIATDTNACIGVDSASAKITVINDSVHASFKINILQDCDSNLNVSLANQSSNALQYNWNFGDGSSASLFNETHIYHLPGTYYITLVVTDTSRCYPVDSITQPVTLLPNAFTDFNAANVCAGKVVQFNNLGSPSASYIWNFGNHHSSTQYSPSYIYSTAGLYDVTLIIIDSTTCNIRDTASHTIDIYQVPIAGFLINADTFNFETPVQFTENSLYYTNLLWNFGDGDTLDDETGPVHVYEKIGVMNVCIEASNADCEDTMCKSLFISFSKLIGVPNAFSPNGDGINDIITVEGKGIVEFNWIIYNRWGERVFETNDRNQGWDGTYKGVLQEMDVYTYLLTGKLINGEDILLKGNITLLR